LRWCWSFRLSPSTFDHPRFQNERERKEKKKKGERGESLLFFSFFSSTSSRWARSTHFKGRERKKGEKGCSLLDYSLLSTIGRRMVDMKEEGRKERGGRSSRRLDSCSLSFYLRGEGGGKKKSASFSNDQEERKGGKKGREIFSSCLRRGFLFAGSVREPENREGKKGKRKRGRPIRRRLPYGLLPKSYSVGNARRGEGGKERRKRRSKR